MTTPKDSAGCAVAAVCSYPYEIIKEFAEGYLEGMGTGPCRLRFKNLDHWIAGWEAGRKDRQTKNTAIDVYLLSIGLPKQRMVSVV